MCGRFAFHSPHETVVQLFAVPRAAPDIAPRWNIAPTSEVAAVRVAGDGRRELVSLHWGLVPSWAKERAIGQRMINARAETLLEKPAFRSAFRRRRCLVLADGYYEWRVVTGGKQPYYVHAASGLPFGMAALWETWHDLENNEPLESCVIVTRESSGVVREIHGRMPVIIPPESYAIWLDPANEDVAALATLLTAEPGAELVAHPVSRRVNSPRSEGAELVEPATGTTA
ncbi:MAG TPA: SOS response-associated peptidase [Steroidobacteraceae bacterium]|nr:SOS response-associated peptidase [Steroidobacteraceae bacterium]